MKTLNLTMTKTAFLLTTTLIASSLLGTTAFADTPTYNRISFNVEAKQEVANDEMRALLTKTTQAKTAKEIAKTLNTSVNNAIAIAKKYPDVIVETSRHSTYPRYGVNNTIIGFTGSASIELKSQNFEQASQLIADLQTMLTLDDLSFHVSGQTQDAIKKQLTLDAAKRFQTEATTISQAFGAKDYKIVSVQLGNDNHYYARPLAMQVMSKDASNAGIEKLSIESGKTTIGYNASGTIELIK